MKLGNFHPRSCKFIPTSDIKSLFSRQIELNKFGRITVKRNEKGCDAILKKGNLVKICWLYSKCSIPAPHFAFRKLAARLTVLANPGDKIRVFLSGVCEWTYKKIPATDTRGLFIEKANLPIDLSAVRPYKFSQLSLQLALCLNMNELARLPAFVYNFQNKREIARKNEWKKKHRGNICWKQTKI